MSAKEFRAVFLHGVGTQGPNYAHPARTLLRATLRRHAVDCHFVSALWAPLADKAENEFLEAVKRKGSSGNLSQDLSVRTLADALMYARSPALQAEIFELLDRELEAFGKHPVTWFAHSLGGLIATDYLRSRGCPPHNEARHVRLQHRSVHAGQQLRARARANRLAQSLVG